MAALDEVEIPKLIMDEGAAPSTPAAGMVVMYAKADGLMYSKDDAGTETLMSGGGSGSVATDAIWDAAGDLVQGTGANTAAKLTAGTSGYVLTSAGAAAANVWAAQKPDCYEAFLTANVTCVNANTAYDGPSLSLPAGSWLVEIDGSLSSANANPTHIVIQIYDGTSVVKTAGGYHGGGAGGGLHLSCAARITLAGTTTVKFQAISLRGSSDTVLLDAEIANGTADKATSIRATRITSI